MSFARWFMQGLLERGRVVHVTVDGAVECDFDLVA
jgi:hypothetical protein